MSPGGNASCARLSLRVPAKVNLWLEVIARRRDGYHELSSLMLPVGIYDRLEIETGGEGGIHLECDAPGVPADSANLAWRAAELYLGAIGEGAGVRLRLEKGIPAGAGMGGGSADAAGVLLGLNRLFGGRLGEAQLHEVARKLGADVPFFLLSQPALATGIGERLARVQGVPAYPLVLLKPPIMVSTAWVYQSFKLTRGMSSIKLSSFLARPWALGEVMANDLETVTLREFPQLSRMKEWLMEQGALGALMSGSGPTVFGIFAAKEQSERVEAQARQVWAGCWVAAADVLSTPPCV